METNFRSVSQNWTANMKTTGLCEASNEGGGGGRNFYQNIWNKKSKKEIPEMEDGNNNTLPPLKPPVGFHDIPIVNVDRSDLLS